MRWIALVSGVVAAIPHALLPFLVNQQGCGASCSPGALERALALLFILALWLITWGALVLPWWLWLRIDTRLQTSGRAGWGAWGPFLFVVVIYTIPIALPLTGTAIVPIITIWMLFGGRWRPLARLLVVQATAGCLLVVAALVWFLVAFSYTDL